MVVGPKLSRHEAITGRSIGKHGLRCNQGRSSYEQLRMGSPGWRGWKSMEERAEDVMDKGNMKGQGE